MLLETHTHMFLATVADGQTAASWGGGEKNCKTTHPDSAFGWVLIGWALGWALGRSVNYGRTKLAKHFAENSLLFCQDHGKGGLSLRGVAFMTVLAVLAVLESTLPSLGLSCKIQHNEAAVAVLTVLAVSAVMAVSVMTATPLKLKPPFPWSWFWLMSRLISLLALLYKFSTLMTVPAKI